MTEQAPLPLPSDGSMVEGPVVELRNVGLAYGRVQALSQISLTIPAGRMVGLIGPDGVGKSSLLSLIAGAHAIQQGEVQVLGGDMADARYRRNVCPRIAYMPQGLGKNLYPTLSVFENIDFFGRLFGHEKKERERRIAELLKSTGLAPFASRPVGKLSGGMKQKLGLCCALIHDPDLLILDEPTTGVDPLSRSQFWSLIDEIRGQRPGMSVLVATAYMDEAARFAWLIAMNAGRVLATGSLSDLLTQTGTASLDAAFIALLPEAEKEGYRPVNIPPRRSDGSEEIAIEADGLTMRFGDFVAVEHVSFRIPRGEIFGFLGSNGCGKTTTMKMLTGLLPVSEGEARLFGRPVDPHDMETRRHVGYMSQAFSLYSELTVRQNLELHARLYRLPSNYMPKRVAEMEKRFGLAGVADSLPDALPLGVRQRLSLAVAMIHNPEVLILDEPTSGVDPIARDALWQILVDLARQDNVTIFISTHFMSEAERCDRISLMHAGKVLVSDTPGAIVRSRGVSTLEEAFIGYLKDAIGDETADAAVPLQPDALSKHEASAPPRLFDLRRMLSYSLRESLELRRDPIRGTLALIGSVILMLVIGYGINLDVDNIRYAVLDRDQTTISQSYITDLAGSLPYFIEQPPIASYEELDRRMRSGELSLAVEIPPNFARDAMRGRPVEIGAWIDGAMPQRGETIRTYMQAMHTHWLSNTARTSSSASAGDPFHLEIRFRYNPDVLSIVAIVPAVIPLLLLLIPAILASLSVVREKELGSVINLYVTPVTKLEFLLGKQLPYILLGLVNFLLLMIIALFVFKVPFTGSFFALSAGTVVYLATSTALGLLISTFTRSQIAALIATAVFTLIPAVEFSGIIDPVSSLAGIGSLIGHVYPTTHYITITRGTFSKALGFADLTSAFIPLLIIAPVLTGLSGALLRKQER